MSDNNRISLSDELSHEGLPQSDDYNPDAIGGADLEAADPVQTWPEFGLEMVPVQMDGEDTGRRMVRRNGKYVADVSERYQLLPNEQAVAAANEVADRLGAQPFHEWNRDGAANDGWFITLDDHVFQDQDRHRVHALYAWDESYFGDEHLEYGFAVHNSIDGSTSFRVGLFTYRHACQNMVLMGLSSLPEGVEQEREVIQSSSHAHTSGLEVDIRGLEERIENAIIFIEDIDQTYRTWVDEVMDPELVDELLQRRSLADDDLPGWMLELKDEYEEAAELNDVDGWLDLDEERRASIARAEMPEATTTWDTYNDVTEAIWHSGTKDTTKQSKYRDVHRVLQPVQ